MSQQLARQDNWAAISHTQADYDPNFNSVEENMGKGKLNMTQNLSRKHLPLGRPINAANLIELP